ncbi:phage associated protein [Neisseria gonorrhoeae]|uniref:Phage associated protein n=1 Tax=Neisseria gonorrhoeae TaxID=485 RepID=A0A378VVX0_NEIGO|nr:phage associated protein [Neisseria gonorrhoeae]
MLNAYDVADFFLSPLKKRTGSKSPISNFKNSCITHKATPLPYLTAPVCRKYRTLAARSGSPLHLPHLQKYGGSPLPAAHIEPDKYADEELVVLNRVRKEQGCYTAWALRNKTHQEAPWIQTRQGEVIGIALMGEYFRHALPQTDYNFNLEKLKTAVEDSFVSVPHFNGADDLEKWLEQ